MERKEVVYSTNPEELKSLKEKVKESTVVKSIKPDRLVDEEYEPTYSNNSTVSNDSNQNTFPYLIMSSGSFSSIRQEPQRRRYVRVPKNFLSHLQRSTFDVAQSKK